MRLFNSLKTLHKLSFVLFCVGTLSGCSVFSALDGKEDPNLNVIIKGMHRVDIEAELGEPLSVEQKCDCETIAVYEYVLGKDPSMLRALAYTTLDLATVGIWEFAGTPVEGLMGDTVRLRVVYDEHSRLISATKVAG